jgi:VCBS repeat-containing protein
MTVQNSQSDAVSALVGDENGPPSTDSTDDTGLLAMVGDLGTVFEPQNSVVGSAPLTPLPPQPPPNPGLGNTSPFVINVTYDQSQSSLPAGFVSAINYVVNYYESIFTSPITVNIDVGYGEIDGQAMEAGALGESESMLGSYSYSTVKSALANVDPSAAATMPSTMPVSGGTMWVATAEAKALGLSPVQPTTSIDGFAGFSSVYPFTYNSNNRAVAGEYDFIGTVEHEFTEIMGRIDTFGESIGNTRAYTPLDMFHYTAPGTHTYTGQTTNYFSVNGGVTNLDNFNSNPGGDLGDWAASAGNDAYLAFSSSGTANTVSQTDITEMNALGYRLAPQTSIAVSGTTTKAVQGGGAVALLSVIPTITDSASTTLSSVTIRIANGSGTAIAGDQLFVNGLQNGSLGNGVTGSWNAGTSTLTLTGAATPAIYDALLGTITYQDTGTDSSSGSHPVRTVTWSASDGTNSFNTTSQVAIDRPPTANSDAASDVAGSTITTTAATGVLSNDTDLDGDSLAVTTFSDVAHGSAAAGQLLAGVYGHLSLGGNGSYSYFADNSSAINAAPTGSHLTDSFTYLEADGNGAVASAILTITLDRAPVVAAANVVLSAGHAPVAASSLFTASDSDGDAITTYGFKDTGSGDFLLNGVAQANNQEIDITSAQLSQLTYQSVTGTMDTLQVRANDGTAWSNWTSFTVSTPLVIASHGPNSLVQVGSDYFLNPVGNSLGAELRYGGAIYTAGQFGAWMPIGMAVTAGGYQVAWKMTGADQYTVWNTDSNGNYVSSAIGVVSGSDVSLEMLEPSFSQDLNGDSTIGAPTTVIEAHGATSLVEIGNTYTLGSSGPTLRYGGATYTAGELGAWAPIGVEATASGYEVAWKMTGADQYTVWNADSSGNYVSSAIGVVSGSDVSLEMLEPSFSQDFNGDSVIGLATTILDGHLGGQTLTAGAGPTALIGGPNDVLNAGAGADTFVFKPNSGSSTINGFAVSTDAVQFDHTVFANVGAVLSQMQQVGSDVVITHDPQNSVTLHDTLATSLTASNFRIL